MKLLSNDEISIVMNTYRPKNSDKVNSIKKTIQSVLNQKKVDVQFIIVDDGSYEALKEKITKNVEYYYLERGGRNIARNFALKKCTTPCISTTGDDDSLPDNLSLYNRTKHFYALNNPCAIWTRAINVYDTHEKISCPRDDQIKRYNEPIPLKHIKKYTHHAGTLLISTKYIKKYKLDIRWCSEADLLYRIMKIGKLNGEYIYSFPEITFKYTVKNHSKYYKSFPVRLKLLELIKLYYPYYNLTNDMIHTWKEDDDLQKRFKNPYSAFGEISYDNTFVNWYANTFGIKDSNYYNIVTHRAGNNVPFNIDWLYHKTNYDILDRIDYTIENMYKELVL